MKKLQAKPGYSSQEIDILGVTSCVEIALNCVDKDRSKRPCIEKIVHELEELEANLKAMSLASDVSKDLTVQVRLTTGKTWEPSSVLQSSVSTVLACQISVKIYIYVTMIFLTGHTNLPLFLSLRREAVTRTFCRWIRP